MSSTELYVRDLDDEFGDEWAYRPASPSEVLEAARQHVDYEAGARLLHAWDSGEKVPWEAVPYTHDGFIHLAQAIVTAALGIEGEET